MTLHWINNIDLTPIRKGHNARVGTEYRLVNESDESLGFVIRCQDCWLAFDPWLGRVVGLHPFDDLAAARLALVNHNYQERADR